MNDWLSLDLFKIILNNVEKETLIIILLTCDIFFYRIQVLHT